MPSAASGALDGDAGLDQWNCKRRPVKSAGSESQTQESCVPWRPVLAEVFRFEQVQLRLSQPARGGAPVEVLRQLDLTISRRRISRPGGSVRAGGKSTLRGYLARIGKTPSSGEGAGGGIGRSRGLRPAPAEVAMAVSRAYALYPTSSVGRQHRFGLRRKPSLSLPALLQDSLQSPQPAPAPWPADSLAPGGGHQPGGSPRWPNNWAHTPARSTAEGRSPAARKQRVAPGRAIARRPFGVF